MNEKKTGRVLRANEALGKYLGNFAMNILPPSLAAVAQTTKEYADAKALDAKFNSRLENQQKAVPLMQMEIDVLYPSVIVAFFVTEILEEDVKGLKNAIDDYFENSVDAQPLEVEVCLDCIIIQLNDPSAKRVVNEEIVKPILDLAKGIDIKSVLYV